MFFYMLPQWLQDFVRYLNRKKVPTKWRVAIFAGVPLTIVLGVCLGLWFGTLQGHCGANFRIGTQYVLDTREWVRYTLRDGELTIESEFTDYAVDFTVDPGKRLTWKLHRNRIESLDVQYVDIGMEVFAELPNLRELSMTGKMIDSYAFRNCKALETISCPFVDTIIDYAFYGCSSLTEIGEMPYLVYLGDGAFSNCSSLESVCVPDSLMFINKDAFRSCTSLTSVTGMNNIFYIDSNAFRNCASLTEIALPAWSGGGFILGSGAFQSCISLEEITLPADTYTLEEDTFRDCTALKTCPLPKMLMAIGEHCFAGCAALEEMELPVGVSEIGEYAFRGCTGIEEITVPATVLSLDGTAFAGWTEEQTIILHCSRTALQGPLETDATVIWDN